MILLKKFDGSRSTHDSVRSAANFLGVTSSAVFYALKKGTLCKEYRVKKVEEYYAVRVGNDLLICRKSADRKSWLPCCSVNPFPIGKETKAIDISSAIWG